MEKAVVFVNIGWDKDYLGKGVVGHHRYLRTSAAKKYGASEDNLYEPDDSGLYRGGIGSGLVDVPSLDVVFVAQDPFDGHHKAVAIFFDVGWEVTEGRWTVVYTRSVRLIRKNRPTVPWTGRGMRRWAVGGSENHPQLLKTYSVLYGNQTRGGQETVPKRISSDLQKALAKLHARDKERMLQEVKRAVRDWRLRPAVLSTWGAKCALCGSSLETDAGLFECEIAHIKEVKNLGMDSAANALPLCRTHHWAFDQDLWAINPTGYSTFVRVEYRDKKPLKGLHGKRLAPLSGRAADCLDGKAVEARWKRFSK